ncbi:hypothetical protein [Olsenella uli]|uniref:hypothetical protein n=1 Tax=Olsenella uli TaxID=133926 RepID=UPI00044CB090|nr:hypothetical protein [Olsenella uli]EUB31094.1 hypothetical protein HMPREF1503_1853 [Olsenella uli MSTE5]
MKLHVDISLSKGFGVVERTVFRLVLNGYTDASEITIALSLFSRPVVANAIRHLVNRQILTIDMASGQLGIAKPFVAVMNVCLEEDICLEVPDELRMAIKRGGVLLDSGTSHETHQAKSELRQLKASLLEHLVPVVNLWHYVDSLDFTLTSCEGGE